MNTEVLREVRRITKRTRELAIMPKLQTVTVTSVDRGIGDSRVLLASVVFKMNSETSNVVLLFILLVISNHCLYINSKIMVWNPCNIINKAINLVLLLMYRYEIGIFERKNINYTVAPAGNKTIMIEMLCDPQ